MARDQAHQSLRADNRDLRTAPVDGRNLTAMNGAHSTSGSSLHSDATHPQGMHTSGMTAQTLANNTVEQNQKQQPSKDNAKKPWYHVWWW